MACKFYKEPVCVSDKTCNCEGMAAVKYCPFTNKDNKFLNKKAATACKGYQEPPKITPISGIFKPGCCEVGKYYLALHDGASHPALHVVDHNGDHVGGGWLLEMDLRSGRLHRMTAISCKFGFDLDMNESLKI